MRALATDLAHLLWSVPLYAQVGLVWLAVVAWRSRPVDAGLARWRRVLVLACIVLYAASIPATANALRAHLEGHWEVPSPEDVAGAGGADAPTLLVLAAGWIRQGPQGPTAVLGERSWERLACAVELQRASGAMVIFTGAPVPDGSDSVAGRMARMAQRMGVPEQRIGVEARALNTQENLVFSERQFGLRKRGRVVLVTSAVHMPRAVAVAHRIGLDVLPYPCDFRAESHLSWRHFVPSNTAVQSLEEVLHEIAGLLVYRLRGWA
jgi:uncharacterized SAM-binding protein YcdF (DUF218 family)